MSLSGTPAAGAASAASPAFAFAAKSDGKLGGADVDESRGRILSRKAARDAAPASAPAAGSSANARARRGAPRRVAAARRESIGGGERGGVWGAPRRPSPSPAAVFTLAALTPSLLLHHPL